MNPEQEPKYDINAYGQIANRETGEAIPEDEPVFIIRAKDKNAVLALILYKALCSNADLVAHVTKRIQQFTDFATTHPERMKEPD